MLNEDAYGFARNYGGSARKVGCYLHFRLFPSPELAKSSLDVSSSWNNTCEKIALVSIPKGVRMAFGKIEGGSEIQIFVHPEDVVKLNWVSYNYRLRVLALCGWNGIINRTRKLVIT